jgi:hypothetical protein
MSTLPAPQDPHELRQVALWTGRGRHEELQAMVGSALVCVPLLRCGALRERNCARPQLEPVHLIAREFGFARDIDEQVLRAVEVGILLRIEVEDPRELGYGSRG